MIALLALQLQLQLQLQLDLLAAWARGWERRARLDAHYAAWAADAEEERAEAAKRREGAR